MIIVNFPEWREIFHTYTLRTQWVAVVNAIVQKSNELLDSDLSTPRTFQHSLSGYEAL